MLQVTHCPECNGSGRMLRIYGVEDFTSESDCIECHGTGHVVKITEEGKKYVIGIDRGYTVPPAQLIDHEHCSSYREWNCEEEPCPECDLNNERAEE